MRLKIILFFKINLLLFFIIISFAFGEKKYSLKVKLDFLESSGSKEELKYSGKAKSAYKHMPNIISRISVGGKYEEINKLVTTEKLKAKYIIEYYLGQEMKGSHGVYAKYEYYRNIRKIYVTQHRISAGILPCIYEKFNISIRARLAVLATKDKYYITDKWNSRLLSGFRLKLTHNKFFDTDVDFFTEGNVVQNTEDLKDDVQMELISNFDIKLNSYFFLVPQVTLDYDNTLTEDKLDTEFSVLLLIKL